MAKLTPKQQLFIEAYLACLNATEAARQAGYKGNDVTLAAVGYENLRKPQIAAEIEVEFTRRAMSAEEALFRLGQHARGDLADFLSLVEGTSGMFVVDLKKAEHLGLIHLIKKLKYTKDSGVEIELYDAQAALEKILRAHGRFRDIIGNLNIDMATLTDDQLVRLAGGEDIVNVLLGADNAESKSGPRTAAAGG